jgi:putative CocE/NonD family hydrolase
MQNTFMLFMRGRLFGLLLLFAPVLLHAQDAAALAAMHRQYVEDSTYFRTNYTKREIMVPMRDGIKLFTSLYIPKDAGKGKQYPFLMTRTPYSCSPYGEDKYASAFGSRARIVREGFIIVTQDVRGRWGSEGDFVHVRPQGPELDKKKQKTTDESTDTYDAIEWLVKNIEGNNGKVGIHGVSYPGFYSTVAALSNHPALKAVSPQAPVTEWFIGDDVHHGGAFFWMDFFIFLPYFAQDNPKASRPVFAANPYSNPNNYDFFLREVVTPKRANDLFFKDTIPFWKDILAHPNYDEYWKSRNPMPHARGVKPAMLTVGGWFDAEDLYGALKTYEGLEKQNPGLSNRLAMGPWCHGCWWGPADGLGDVSFGSRTGDYYLDSLFLPFMNHHLKGVGPEPNLAEATMFETGSNRWRKFAAWPPKAETRDLYLQAGRKIGTGPMGNSFEEYVSDPSSPVPYQGRVHWRRTTDYMLDDQRFASTRPDVLTFETEILAEDLTLAGPIEALLNVSISSTDADFVVKLIDVYPNVNPPQQYKDAEERKGPVAMGGYQQLVRGEIIRGRYRNSFEKPEAFTPGQSTRVKIELPDVLHTFKKGHKLMIQVQSSWFPLADRNPQQFINIYNANPEDYKKATIRLYHDSRVRVPVLK